MYECKSGKHVILETLFVTGAKTRAVWIILPGGYLSICLSACGEIFISVLASQLCKVQSRNFTGDLIGIKMKCILPGVNMSVCGKTLSP